MSVAGDTAHVQRFLEVCAPHFWRDVFDSRTIRSGWPRRGTVKPIHSSHISRDITGIQITRYNRLPASLELKVFPPPHQQTMSLFLIRKNCRFSEADFADFYHYMTKQLRNPKNNTGLRSVGQTVSAELRRDWDIWLDSFIDDDIGKHYWGQGTARIWCYPADRSK